MKLQLPSLYTLKKTLLYPRKLYLRHKEKLEPGFLRSAMELHYYRPAFYRWLGAVSKTPALLHEADLGDDSVILDVGAYIGEWAQEMDSRYGGTIHAFEPDPRNFARLKKRFDDNPRLIPHAYGLGGRSEVLSMTLKFMGSTLFEQNSPEESGHQAEVEILDVCEMWQQLHLGRVDLMKINIEGAEFPLLERMQAQDLLDRVDCFLIQFHEWHPGAYRRRRAIQHALAKTHTLVWDYHFIWEKWVRR